MGRSDETAATMPLVAMRECLDSFSRYNVPGIIWGGGDPTLNPHTYEAMRYAKTLGLQSSFLTNGSMLTQSTIKELIDIEPKLIRISLNCGSEAVHRAFHGYSRQNRYFDKVVENIYRICRQKRDTKNDTIFGLSIIIDERNIENTITIAHLLRDIISETGRGTISFAVFRPVFNYYEAHGALNSGTYEKISALLRKGGLLWQLFTECGIEVVIPKTDSLKPFSDAAASTDSTCLAYSWCTELHPNGDIFFCSERYGNPDFRIGNIFREDLMDIWRGRRRAEVLRMVNKSKCFCISCPHQSRGHHLNRIFHQIEQKRKEGRIEEVRMWVEQLRQVTKPVIPYFL